MSKNTNQGSEKLHSMRRHYLRATYNRQESISQWKKLEAIRSALKAAMIFFVLVGIALGASLLALYWSAEDARKWILAGVGLAIGLLFCVAAGVVRYRVSGICEEKYIAYFVHDMFVQDGADAIKAETVDPVLENSIVISVHSTLTAPAEYEEREITRGEIAKINDEETLMEIQKYRAPADIIDVFGKKVMQDGDYDHFSGSVNHALVFVDDIEVGVVDLDSEFSVFRVNPGLHTLRIKIRKDYPHYDKTLNIETPVTPVYIENDYRIFRYAIDAVSADNQTVSYKLKCAEYDDMATFRRDLHNSDRLERLERDAELSPHLCKRAETLYAKLSIQDKYIDAFREEEEKRYLRHKYQWLNKTDKEIDPRLLYHYRTEVRRLQQEIYAVQTNPRFPDFRKAKMIDILEARMSELLSDLYSKLNLPLDQFPARRLNKLRNILLFGQESIRFEQIAEQLTGNAQDARLPDNKKPNIAVNIQNAVQQ